MFFFGLDKELELRYISMFCINLASLFHTLKATFELVSIDYYLIPTCM